jgi:hypothetical protein
VNINLTPALGIVHLVDKVEPGLKVLLRTRERFSLDGRRGRLVADRGAGALAWVQNLSNKPILEIHQAGRALPPFEDYLGFSLSFAQLTNLFRGLLGANPAFRIPTSIVGAPFE